MINPGDVSGEVRLDDHDLNLRDRHQRGEQSKGSCECGNAVTI
jgi:hypothetical protein